jgi:hypothetical protein
MYRTLTVAIRKPPRPGFPPVLLGGLARHRLHIGDRIAVDGLKSMHEHPQPRHLGYSDAVQADGVGPIRGAGAEDSPQRAVRVIARPGDQFVALCPVQPGQHEDLGAGPEITDPFADGGLEHDPGRRRALVALARRLRPVGQW